MTPALAETTARVHIGVTGHRALRDAHVLPGVDAALTRIEKNYPGHAPVIVSALAEGADRLVALRAIDHRGATLVAVLPMAADEYEADFASADSRAEFRRLLASARKIIVDPLPPNPRPAAYQRAGERVLALSDLLVAVWDGEPARGQGGTGEIVASARVRGLPMAWVHTTGAPGAVTFERFSP